MAFDGTHLWAIDNHTRKVYQIFIGFVSDMNGDGDSDGSDLAGLAATRLDEDNLVKLAAEFGVFGTTLRKGALQRLPTVFCRFKGTTTYRDMIKLKKPLAYICARIFVVPL